MFTFLLRIIAVGLLLWGVWWWMFVHESPLPTSSNAPNGQQSDRSGFTTLNDVVSSTPAEEERSGAVEVDNITNTDEGEVDVSDSAEEAQEDIDAATEAATFDFSAFDTEDLPEKMMHDVPFVSQAPLAQWDDARFQDACEEASIVMASLWTQNQEKPSEQDATTMLEDVFAAEKEFFSGDPLDTSTYDTERFAQSYFDFNSTYIENITKNDIVLALAAGYVVIVPTDGKALKNPYFSGDGPDRHMLLIRGYDQKKNVFITNDPGTKRGARFAYDMDILHGAIRDYDTGYHEPFGDTVRKNAIIVTR